MRESRGVRPSGGVGSGEGRSPSPAAGGILDICSALAHKAGMTTQTSPALALFSGGLDSILAVRLIMEQGVPVRCLHFVSPFFGNVAMAPRWERMYGLDVTVVDAGEEFVRMLRERPAHGYGSVMNPCVDCKILMLRRAGEMMAESGAPFVISGEVLGQRPMSQRRDTLNLIRRESGLGGRLLRPLSALHLPPTPMEEDGTVDRERLCGIFGRGRKDQMQLAERFGLKEIPTPAGGCRLTERENARRYWPVLTRLEAPGAKDFVLANTGRQVWAHAMPMGEEGAGGDVPACWLSVGRNQGDNDALFELAGPDDVLFKVADVPGPVGFGRLAAAWSPAMLADAAAYVASYSPKAVALAASESGGKGEVGVRLIAGKGGERSEVIRVRPARETPAVWREEDWESVREAVRAINRELAAQK